jgi:ATP-dependent Clp protease ATP-binding subunit ClpA
MFRPEFLNRVDAGVVLKSLTTSQISSDLSMRIALRGLRLADQKTTIDVTDTAKQLLARKVTTGSMAPGRVGA